MILIWRGWGLLAVVAIFPLLGSCIAFVDLDSKWPVWIASLASLILGGAACVGIGMRLNRPRYEHTFFFLPLQFWGCVYLATVVAWAGCTLVLSATHGQGRNRVIGIAVGLVALVAAGAAAAAAVRWAGRWRPAPGSGPVPGTPDEPAPVDENDLPATDYSKLRRFGQ